MQGDRPADLVARDAAVLWHPATHFGDLERVPIRAIERASGPWLYEPDGTRILDAISSWWTSIHGHGHPAIVEAIREQAARLDHVMFAGFTHRSAVELAELLVSVAPPGYGRVFYADCGSAAVEVALKLSYQSRPQRGEPTRRRFATLAGAYHGETLGALAVCGPGAYRDTFAGLLPEPIVLPVPELADHRHADLGTEAGADTEAAETAVALLSAHASELTALVVEPLVQCANRMAMHGTGYYRRIVETAQRLGIHVIADEIAVAFGRTGRTFASAWAGVTPDLLCLSKGLSGGVLPLSCVLVRRGFDDDFRGAPARSFLHSHTFTGNPITCAAGLASLRLLQSAEVQAALPGRIAALSERAARVKARCPTIAHVRQAGLVVALEVRPSSHAGKVEDGRLGLHLRAAAMRRGVLLRPLHDTIYWMPPLSTPDDVLDHLADVTAEVVQEVLG
jgi:adenosylmethionine-8-amino-7-oxononanoate aminotransferase